LTATPPPPPYLTQAAYVVVVNAMEQLIALLNNILLNNFLVNVAFASFPDLNATYQATIGAVALDNYTAILTKLQSVGPLAPTS